MKDNKTEKGGREEGLLSIGYSGKALRAGDI